MEKRSNWLATAAVWLVIALLIAASILFSVTWHKGSAQSEAKLVQREVIGCELRT